MWFPHVLVTDRVSGLRLAAALHTYSSQMVLHGWTVSLSIFTSSFSPSSLQNFSHCLTHIVFGTKMQSRLIWDSAVIIVRLYTFVGCLGGPECVSVCFESSRVG